MKIICPQCRNTVGEYQVTAELIRIEVWTRRGTSYKFEALVSALGGIRLGAQCGMATCGHEWDVLGGIVPIQCRDSAVQPDAAIILSSGKQASMRTEGDSNA